MKIELDLPDDVVESLYGKSQKSGLSIDAYTKQLVCRLLSDPVELALFTAPPDDEPLSAHERHAIAEGERRKERGEPVIPTKTFSASLTSPIPIGEAFRLGAVAG